mgnify:CR=1 FL=1
MLCSIGSDHTRKYLERDGKSMELKERISRVMKQSIHDCEVMGVNLLVEKDGRELLYCEEGMADRENHKPIRRDTIFRLYSQTKPVTAVCAMILMERGLLDLGTSVSEYLPAYANMQVEKNGEILPSEIPVRVYDLLRMTSGLVYPDIHTESEKAVDRVYKEACSRLHTEDALTTRELADRLAQCPLAFEPGTGWKYGTSADVLGAVIEVVSGKKLSEFMQEEIFCPLEMRDTAFWVPEEKQDRLAKVYETVCEKNGNRSMRLYTGDNLAVRNDMAEPPAYEAGGAGLVSTLDDYMKFARMLLQHGTFGEKQILKPETVHYLCSGQLLPKQQRDMNELLGLEGYSYANLMRICKNPSQAVMLAGEGEYGWDGWLGMYFANFPKEKMTILMGTQKKDAGTFALTRKLRNVILSECMK